MKIKLKNNQLASALKKLKKPTEKKAAPVKKQVKKVAEEEEAQETKPKKMQVIRKAADVQREQEEQLKKAQAKKAEPKVEVAKELPKQEESTPKEKAAASPAAEKPAAKPKRRIGEIVQREPTPKPKPKAPESTADAKKTEKPKREFATPAPEQRKDVPRKDKAAPKKPQSFRPFDSRDRHGLRGDEEQSQWRRRRPHKFKKRSESKPEPVRPTEISVRLPITVKDLSHEMKLKASQLVQKMFLEGMVLTLNDYIDDETVIELLGHEFGVKITIDTSEEERLAITEHSIQDEIAKSDSADLKTRPPVITFMGHVDHGKTSLIDKIREANVASGEAGAITQHIGAFRVPTSHGDVAILDTPGHEAFYVMRERGAAITDIIILVVAGDEGIKPQTEEAIKHAQDANLPMVVAVNKCDKENFDIEKVYRELADRNLLPEAWGGDVLTIQCSAKSGKGISDLLETTALQAEMLELKANPNTRARGTVIESELHKGLGCVATILVQNGTLRLGDALVLGDKWGRIKTMHDEKGRTIEAATPSTPVRVTGLSGLPIAGGEFVVVDSEREARDLADERSHGQKRAALMQRSTEGFEALLERESELQQKKVLPVIIRADVQGSVEALRNSLEKIHSKKVELAIVSAEVGEVSESDVQLAAASNSVIIAFHTQIENHAENLIKQEKVRVKSHDIIYHVVDDVKDMMRDCLDKVRQENYSGTAIVRQTFKSSQLGVIAGCVVEDGVIEKDNLARIFRDDEMVWEGNINSLKRVKENVNKIAKGLECGILLQNNSDIREDDVIKTYKITYVEQDL